MNKLGIKKILSKQIKIITQVEKSMAIDRWNRAKALSEMHSMVVWSKSPYKSFKNFIVLEFPNIHSGSAWTWVSHYNRMSNLYTWTQIQQLAKTMTYFKAVNTQQWLHGKPKISLSKFITLAKNTKIPYYAKKYLDIPNENKISLRLPRLYVQKLEAILSNYGYVPPKFNHEPKQGISEAMVKYLDTL